MFQSELRGVDVPLRCSAIADVVVGVIVDVGEDMLVTDISVKLPGTSVRARVTCGDGAGSRPVGGFVMLGVGRTTNDRCHSGWPVKLSVKNYLFFL